jgi:hypothetical protein
MITKSDFRFWEVISIIRFMKAWEVRIGYIEFHLLRKKLNLWLFVTWTCHWGHGHVSFQAVCHFFPAHNFIVSWSEYLGIKFTLAVLYVLVKFTLGDSPCVYASNTGAIIIQSTIVSSLTA